MPASTAVSVRGLRELNQAFARADKDTRKFVREAEKEVAEPIRVTAEHMAATNIRKIGQRWPQMRIGVTTKVVYVAPKSKGRKGSKRKNLAGLLMDKAMQPALDRHRGRVEHDLEKALDKMADHFNRGT